MFNTDKPINYISEDKLGRSTFAKQLAKALVNVQIKDNYAVSLQGKWGCGKTSVLNMVIDEIRQLSKEMYDVNRTIIIKFNPWNFTETNQLINQFFLTLTNELKIDNKDKKAKKVGTAIEKYSSALEYSEYIPVVGKYLKLLPKLAAKLGKSMEDKANSKLNDVSYRKGEVEKALLELQFRIIVVIDDIDRLSNEQIRLIFQLVNAVAGFPNITYLLSFDKDIVSRALEDVQGCKGKEYLEKIIQVPFDVPPINISKLHNIMFDKLDSLIQMPNGIQFDENRWSSVFSSCVSPFISTLRDVNRYCNALSFIYPTIKSEVDFIDTAGISALQIFAFPIYEWIRDNKFSLAGGYSGGGISISNVSKDEEEFLQRFKKIYPDNPQVMLNAVASLFPKFSNKISFSSIFQTPSDLHQAMRIASESKFDLYFSLSLDDVKISRSEIDNALLNMKEDMLRKYINSINERNLFGDFLREIENNLSRIPEERIELILSVIAFKNGRIANKETKLIGAESTSVSIYIIIELINIISDENTRFNFISNMFLNTDFLSFQYLLHLLHIIELTHGRIAETYHMQDTPLISLEHLNILETIFIKRTKCFTTITNLFDWKEFYKTAMLWNFIEEKTYSEYIKSMFTNRINVVKFLVLYVTVWSSDGKICEFEFNNDSYTQYVSKADLIEIIKEARKNKEFWELDEKVIESSIAFFLANEPSNEKKKIEINDVNEVIAKWKKDLLK